MPPGSSDPVRACILPGSALRRDPTPGSASPRAGIGVAALVLSFALATLLPAATPAAQTGEALPRYELELTLAPGSGHLVGRALVTLPASAVDDRGARFDIAGNGVVLQIDRLATADGRALERSEADEDGVIEVRLPASPEPVTVAVDYHRDVTDAQLEPFGYWAFAPFGPSTWAYPEIVMPDGRAPRFADFDVTLEHPASLAVLTTGGLGGEGTVTGADDDRRVRIRQVVEHVEGFAIVAGEGFRVTRHEGGGVPVVAFYHPDHEERFERVVEATTEAAAWYRRTYGFFPLDEVGVIQGHPQWGGGYPLPNLYAFHLGILDDDHITWITAHELGHYYWGLHVLADEERLDWLQLALGIWSDQLYLAERNGRSLPEQWRSGRRQGDWFADWLEAVVAGHEQRLGLTDAESGSLGFDYNSLIRHGKAATGLYLQSLLLGPERFLELQRRILQEYRHRPLPEAELVQLLVEAGLDDASAFFAAWKQDDARIGATVASVEPDEEPGRWRIEVARTGTVPYPIEVRVVTEGGETVEHVMAAHADTDSLSVADRPASVALDPDGAVPMWNSAHPEIRAAFARALDRAGIDATFLPLARELLDAIPGDDYLRYRLARRLFWLGRWDEAAALYPREEPCDGYDACLGALYGARALARVGDGAAAETRLTTLRPGAERHGAGSFWETVQREATEARRP